MDELYGPVTGIILDNAPADDACWISARISSWERFDHSGAAFTGRAAAAPTARVTSALPTIDPSILSKTDPDARRRRG